MKKPNTERRARAKRKRSYERMVFWLQAMQDAPGGYEAFKLYCKQKQAELNEKFPRL